MKSVPDQPRVGLSPARATAGGGTHVGRALGERLPALDGLRGAAALLVLVSHLSSVGLIDTYPMLSGTFGVMIFFALSGFLMGHLYLWKPFDAPAVAHYLTARVARVLPLFYAVVCLSYALSRVIGPDFTYFLDTRTFVRELLMVGSAHVFWSIPPEIEFYFVFLAPWWLLARGRLAALAPALLAGTLLLVMAHPLFPGITVFNKLHIFLAGVGAAVVRRQIGERIAPGAALAVQLGAVALVLLIVSGLLPIHDTRFGFDWEGDRVYGSLGMALLAGTVVLAFTVPTGFARALFANPAMARIGAYSFSLYLLHEPVMAGIVWLLRRAGMPWIVQLVAAVAAAIAVAGVTFHLFEMPMQTLVRRALTRLAQPLTRPRRAA